MNVVQVHGVNRFHHGCLDKGIAIGGNYIVDIDVFWTLDQLL